MTIENPNLTGEAEGRWLSRANGDPSIGPVAAWNEGKTLPEWHGYRCKEARYHEPTHTVLLVDDRSSDEPAIVTVLDAYNLTASGYAAVCEVADGLTRK